MSPRLRDGVTTVLATLVSWSRPTRRVPRIEATGGFVPRRPAEHAGAAMMLSGGLDSLALLRKNRLDFPLDHPRSYRTAFFVHGFDLDDDPSTCDVYRVAREDLEAVAQDASLRLIRFGSNVRTLGSRWGQEHQSGAMAAVGHACSDRTRELEIASSYTWDTLFPYGSHPNLDLHYSGDDLVVRHADLARGRLAKTLMLGDWPAGLAALRVCWEGDPPKGFVNCGVCHKCVLTLVELEAAGCLERCPSFPVREVTPELAERLKAVQRTSIPFFAELVEPLEQRGRGDLAAVLRRKLAGIETHLARQARGRWWKRAFVRRRS